MALCMLIWKEDLLYTNKYDKIKLVCLIDHIHIDVYHCVVTRNCVLFGLIWPPLIND